MLDVTPTEASPPAQSSSDSVRPKPLPQIPALTGLRFFAAFFILFAHASDWLAQFQHNEIGEYFSFVAMYGMPLFFVLSGFVIHYNYRSLFTSHSPIRATCEFAAARFARLFPLYFCLLLMAIAADSFVSKVHNQGDLWVKILAYYITLTQSWWYIVYGDQSIIYWLFSVSWSISTEMFFYAAFVAAIYSMLAIRTPQQSKFAVILYPLVVLAFLLWVRYFLNDVLAFAQPRVPNYIGLDRFDHSFYRWLFYFSPYIRVLEFFMGCLAAHAFVLHVERPVSAREKFIADFALIFALAALVFFGACYLSFVRYGQLGLYVQFLALNFLCAPAIAIILVYVSRYDGIFTRFMCAPLLVALGDMSYSIYLIHTWTLRIFNETPAPQLNWLWGGEALYRVLCGISLTLVVSYATYHLIEAPSRIWMRKKLNKLIAMGFDDGPRQSVLRRIKQQ